MGLPHWLSTLSTKWTAGAAALASAARLSQWCVFAAELIMRRWRVAHASTPRGRVSSRASVTSGRWCCSVWVYVVAVGPIHVVMRFALQDMLDRSLDGKRILLARAMFPIRWARRAAGTAPVLGRAASGASAGRCGRKDRFMNVLGISCFYHDAAARAAARTGKSSRRAKRSGLTRPRNTTPTFPCARSSTHSKKAASAPATLTAVAFYDKAADQVRAHVLPRMWQTFPRLLPVLQQGHSRVAEGNCGCHRSSAARLKPLCRADPLITEHHTSHAASAFLVLAFRGSRHPHR